MRMPSLLSRLLATLHNAAGATPLSRKEWQLLELVRDHPTSTAQALSMRASMSPHETENALTRLVALGLATTTCTACQPPFPSGQRTFSITNKGADELMPRKSSELPWDGVAFPLNS